MKKLLLSFLLIGGFAGVGYGQIFTQNFSSSAVVGDYVSSTPGPGQFNSIGMSNASNGGVSVVNNALRLNRTTSGISGTAQFTRNDLLTTAPTFLAVKFTMSVSNSSTAAVTAATFYVGNTLPTANSTTPSTSNAHSRFAVNLTTNSTEFQLRDITGGTNSAVFNGSQQIFFAVNNSGGALNYTAPNNVSTSLPNDTWDLWVGTTRVFTAVSAWGAAVDLNAIRFMFTGTSSNVGSGNIDITNIEIHSLQTLPISLNSFKAKANLQQVDLTWNTAAETNNARFEILRSADGKTFNKIDEVSGAGTSTENRSYAYTDQNPLPGVNYYKLKQVDFDGQYSFSEVEAVKSNVAASNFKVAANKQNGTVKLTVYAANNGKATFKIYDLNGRKLAEQELNLSKGYSNVSVPFNGGNGLLIASLTTPTETLTQKFIQ